MRDIIFRGKTKDKRKNKFIYGNLFIEHDGSCYIAHNKFNFAHTWSEDLVDPETIGQFTGLKDDIGNRIYEDDVVEIYCSDSYTKTIHKVTWGNGSGDYPAFTLDYAKYDDNCNALQLAKLGGGITVIGNVFDNPEMLDI